MHDKTFQISFNSDIGKIKGIVDNALSFLVRNNPYMSSEEKSDIKLVLSELLYNAAIHGNKQNNSKNVYLRLKLKGNSVYSVVVDEGKGFNYLDYMPQNKNEIMKESGRGIKLAYSLTDALAFNSKGNEIKFFKKVTPNG